MNAISPIDLVIPEPFEGLWGTAAYKVLRGGRGGAKSWEVARYLVIKATYEPHRILCAREFQTSMADSVHKLLVDTIERLGLRPFFRITDTAIMAWATGTEFIFKGLRRNIREIKSMEGITITWVEEAQSVSEFSWELLLPTVFRRKGAELLITYNPENADDPTDLRFWQAQDLPDVWRAHVNWSDNPFFPEELDKQRRYMQTSDPDAYAHVWGGGYRMVSDAQIFKGKYKVESFTAPDSATFYHGMDFGFANDPAAVVRAFIDPHRQAIMIDYAVFGHGIPLNDLPDFIKQVPTAERWPIKADNSRPETINFLSGKGFNISGAEKWDGSIKDGIEHLRGYAGGVVIHERCHEMIDEAKLYRYKTDPLNEKTVLPVIIDKFNHGWDALRYGMGDLIRRSSPYEVLAKLGGGK